MRVADVSRPELQRVVVRAFRPQRHRFPTEKNENIDKAAEQLLNKTICFDGPHIYLKGEKP